MHSSRRLPRALPLAVLAIGVAGSLGSAFTSSQDSRRATIEQAIAALEPRVKLPACSERADEARWKHAGPPDAGRARPLISGHRGGNTLAPENTLAAYEAAFGYGVDFVEVDVRETKDGHFVANHDATLDRTTGRAGNVADLTLAEIKALNAASYAPWRGGPYDPSRIATLEEVLELARRAGGGLELDTKIGEAAQVESPGLSSRTV